MTGAIFGLAASYITFRELWTVAGSHPPPPPPPPSVTGGKGDEQEKKEAREAAREVMPFVVESGTGVPGSASSYGEVKSAQT